MTSQSNYGRNGSHQRQFYPSQASLSTAESPQYGFREFREMGPPPLDLPQPVEIDLQSSRTLPSPSSSFPWDIAPLNTPGFGSISSTYGSSNLGRMSQGQTDSQLPGSATQNPLLQWYSANDGPWIPKGLSEVPEDRIQSRQTGSRMPMSFGGQYRQTNPAENGFQFAVPHSDSGYGTRRSIGNASVFSGDIPERDQDCQSIAGHIENFQPFQGVTDDVQCRDVRVNDAWVPLASSSDSSDLFCSTCNKTLRTRSEMKKHELRHTKPFICRVQGCTRTNGFSTTNDMERHTRSLHPETLSESEPAKLYKCFVPGCKSKDKSWPRLDNFRSHLKRVHENYLRTENDFEDLIQKAESWNRSRPSTDQDNLLNGPNLSGKDGDLAKLPNAHNDWKDHFPPMDSSILLNPKSHSKDPKSNATPADMEVSCTVEPLKVLRSPPEAFTRRMPLQSVLSDPVGLSESRSKGADGTHQPELERSIGKAEKSNEVTSTDATITEAIKTALIGAKNPDQERPQELQRKTSPGEASASKPAVSRPTVHINLEESSEEDATESNNSKVLEILKALQKVGYIIQKDPNHHSASKLNSGSAASKKSENQVTCQTCKKFKGRPCELKKHMKRHSRPYGCTLPKCDRTFGSKNDWKRHENSQHYHLESWRCDIARPPGSSRPCAKVCYRRQTFQEHLKKDHDLLDSEVLQEKFDNCRMGRNCSTRFWCGFCGKLVGLKKKGLDAWTERFDHIDDHFMGRKGLEKVGIEHWVPVDGEKPKGEFEGFRKSSDSSSASGSGSSSRSDGSSPEPEASTSASAAQTSSGSSSARPITIFEEEQPTQGLSARAAGKRRTTSQGDDISRPAKHARTEDIVVYCCQCVGAGHNLKLEQNCIECHHSFCASCTREEVP